MENIYRDIGQFWTVTYSFIYFQDEIESGRKSLGDDPIICIKSLPLDGKEGYIITTNNSDYKDLECMNSRCDTRDEAFLIIRTEFKKRARQIKIANILADLA